MATTTSPEEEDDFPQEKGAGGNSSAEMPRTQAGSESRDLEWEGDWGFAHVRGSLYAVGPAVREMGAQFERQASLEAVACREKRDGQHRFHVTVVHRTSVMSNAGGGEAAMSKRARLADLLGRAAAVRSMTPDQGAPEALWRPIPLYVYQTRGEHAAVAVALLFLPAELLLLQTGYPSAALHVTLGFNETDERDPRARRLEAVKVLQYCQSGAELVEVLEALTTVMRKPPASKDKAVTERLGQLVDELLALIDHMQRNVPAEDEDLDSMRGAAAALSQQDSARVSLVCSLRAYLSDDPAISLTHAQDALDMAMALPRDQEQQGRELAVRACRRAAAALAALGEFERAQALAEQGMGLRRDDEEEDPQLRQLWRACLAHFLEQNARETRYRLTVLGVKLPRNFSWVLPWKLAGMSQPMESEQVDVLSRIMGVRLIVSIFDVPAIPQDWLDSIPPHRRPQVLFLPVPNLAAPSLQQADQFVAALTATLKLSGGDGGADEESGAVVVHCGGGKGRAGTLLALAMMELKLGQGWNDVLHKLRDMRPGSVESAEQEVFLREYQKHRGKRLHAAEPVKQPQRAATKAGPEASAGGGRAAGKDDARDPQPATQTARSHANTGSSTTTSSSSKGGGVRVLLLVGLPCSGKSTLARLLGELSNGRALSVSQDGAGSKSAFLARAGDLLQQARKLTRAGGSPAILLLDRCHATADARAETLSSLGLTPQQVEVVELAADGDLCADRMLHRTNHATLHFNPSKGSDRERARKLVESFEGRLSFPSSSGAEGFKRVHRLTDAAQLPAFVHGLLLEAQAGGRGVDEADVVTLLQQDLARHSVQARRGQMPASQQAAPLLKFPRTKHLCAKGSGVGRDDLVLAEHERDALFLDGKTTITIEEKLDGANLGISIDPHSGELRFQNRSHFVSSESAPQFAPLERWAEARRADLYRLLLSVPGSELVLYGEWLHARHSVAYTSLPDWFVLFDMYDATLGTFLSADTRDRLVAEHTEGGSISVPPCLARRPLSSMEEVLALMQGPSSFGQESMEGVVLRREEAGVLTARAKLVRPEFLRGMEEEEGGQHWSKKKLVKNGLIPRWLGSEEDDEAGKQQEKEEDDEAQLEEGPRVVPRGKKQTAASFTAAGQHQIQPQTPRLRQGFISGHDRGAALPSGFVLEHEPYFIGLDGLIQHIVLAGNRTRGRQGIPRRIIEDAPAA